jgi:hypothetical protein
MNSMIMKKKKTGRFALCVLLTIALSFAGFASTPVTSGGAEAYADTVQISRAIFAPTPNQTVVGFGGKQWWVIGYDGNGIYTTAGDKKATLYAKNADFGQSQFRDRSDSRPADTTNWYQYYEDSGGWYRFYNTGVHQYYMPNALNGSDLWNKLLTEYVYFGLQSLQTLTEVSLVSPRMLTDVSGSGNSYSMHWWPLSEDEGVALGSQDVRRYDGAGGGDYWLRTPWPSSYISAYISPAGGTGPRREGKVGSTAYVRPAMSIDLGSVEYTTPAVGGKNDAIDDTLSPAASIAADTPVKLTVKSDTRMGTSFRLATTSTIRAQAGTPLTFEYSGAANLSSGNSHISALIRDSYGTKYYGKLKNITTAEDRSGSVSFKLPQDLSTGNIYWIYFYNEEVNADNYTDFCSAYQVVPCTVSSADEYPPQMTNFERIGVTWNSAFVQYTLSESAKVWYMVYPAADAEPDVETVKAQGNAVWKSRTGVPIPAGNTLVSIPDLAQSSDYVLYAVSEDVAGNTSGVASFPFSTIAPTPANPPSIDPQTVSASAIRTDTSVTLPSAPIGETWEYRVQSNGVWSAWQDSPTFSGLSPDTVYTFEIRVKGSQTHGPSAVVAVQVKTKPGQTGTNPGGDNGGNGDNNGNNGNNNGGGASGGSGDGNNNGGSNGGSAGGGTGTSDGASTGNNNAVNDVDKVRTGNDGNPILTIEPSVVNPLDFAYFSEGKSLTIEDRTWTGKQIRSGLSIKASYNVNGKNITKILRNGSDYTITKTGKNKSIGRATVSIKGSGAFVGTKDLTFKIVPKKPTALKLKASKKSIKVTFRKVSNAQKIKTYKIEYRIKGAARWKAKTVKVKLTGKAGKNKTASLTLKNLKPKKTYEVRVYAYKGEYKGLPTGARRTKSR